MRVQPRVSWILQKETHSFFHLLEQAFGFRRFDLAILLTVKQ